jgi:Protein of unknown function (DUF3343)
MNPACIFVFQSTYLTFRAEKALKSAGIACALVTKPRHISSDCGLAVRIAMEKRGAAGSVLSQQSIPCLGVW